MTKEKISDEDLKNDIKIFLNKSEDNMYTEKGEINVENLQKLQTFFL